MGKTTLARQIAQQRQALVLDLESPADRAKLQEPELFLNRHHDQLLILDEVQRLPGLFEVLRGVIDANRLSGRRSGQFLLLGSASVELIRQRSESLAGRICYLELCGLSVLELGAQASERLWIRGGFPDSVQAPDDASSSIWREQFIRTYLERDIPQLGPRIPAETLRRFWTMLAHNQGGLLNAAALGRALGVDGTTIRHYLDLLVDLLLVRQLQPLFERFPTLTPTPSRGGDHGDRRHPHRPVAPHPRCPDAPGSVPRDGPGGLGRRRSLLRVSSAAQFHRLCRSAGVAR